MEEWRYNELKYFDITFSDFNKINEPNINGSSYYKGLFITGKNSKSKTLLNYIRYLNTDTIVLIDDRKEHLDDVKQFCEAKSIKFIGIQFLGLQKIEDSPNPLVAIIQKKYLIEYKKWLEDEEAQQIINELISFSQMNNIAEYAKLYVIPELVFLIDINKFKLLF
jgi:hypothetical protein